MDQGLSAVPVPRGLLITCAQQVGYQYAPFVKSFDLQCLTAIHRTLHQAYCVNSYFQAIIWGQISTIPSRTSVTMLRVNFTVLEKCQFESFDFYKYCKLILTKMMKVGELLMLGMMYSRIMFWVKYTKCEKVQKTHRKKKHLYLRSFVFSSIRCQGGVEGGSESRFFSFD